MPIGSGHARWFVGRAIAFAVLLASVALLLWSGHVPCVFAEMTHLPCPGCGSSRAVHALVRGDLAGVLRTNPFGPVLAAIATVILAMTWLGVLRDGNAAGLSRSRTVAALTKLAVAVAALQAALWIARFFGAFGGPVPVTRDALGPARGQLQSLAASPRIRA